MLCTFLYTSELISANPMPLVGRPKVAKTLPKGLPACSVAALLAVLDAEPERRRSDWIERDRALILTSLLAGLRADELSRANIGDVRSGGDCAVIQVRGKGGKDRRVPIEPALVAVLEEYLDTRLARFPTTARRRSSPGRGLAAWPPTAPLFVGPDGDRITRGTLQYRVLRAFRRAGIEADRARGALVHGLRHTFATELADAGVSVYELMKPLGHESMVTSQRYVTGAGAETRTAASQNKLYKLLEDSSEVAQTGFPHTSEPPDTLGAAWSAAARRPGLVVCTDCWHMLKRSEETGMVCDCCGHLCIGAENDDVITVTTVAVDALAYHVGTCRDCVPASTEGQS